MKKFSIQNCDVSVILTPSSFRMDASGVIKVSDFGLAENLYSRNYFREVKDGAKLPIKWMALESIRTAVFTEKSDVVSVTAS